MWQSLKPQIVPELEPEAPAESTALERTPSATPSPSFEPQTPQHRAAAMAVEQLFTFCEPPDVADPRAWIAGLVTLFAQYPPHLLAVAIDPARGIPVRLKSLKNFAAIKEVLEDLCWPIDQRAERERLSAQLLLPPPARTEEQQRAISEQVRAWRKSAGLLPP